MTGIVGAVLPLLVGAAVAIASVALLTTRRLDVALPVLLDLLLVAGLLRLTSTGTWAAIASAALIVLIRRLATTGIGAAGRARGAGRTSRRAGLPSRPRSARR